MAAVPVLGYSVAFVYEAGQCDYYGLPDSVISLTLWQVVRGCFAVVASVLSAAGFVIGISGICLKPPKNHPWPASVKELFLRWGIVLTFALALLFVERFAFGAWILVVFLVVYGFFTFVLPCMRRRDLSYVEVLAERERSATPEEWGVWDVLLPSWRRSFALLLLFVAMICLTFSVGRTAAAHREDYNVVQVGGRSFAILRIYDGVCYCGAIHSQGARMTGEYTALNEVGLEWTHRETGRLIKLSERIASDESRRVKKDRKAGSTRK